MSAPMSAVRHPVLRALGPVHDRLLWYVLAAAALGLGLGDNATRLAPAVPVFLAGQVAGVALTLDVRRLVAVARRPAALVAALAVQWSVLPLAGIGLSHLASAPRLGVGTVIAAASPAEITSALVAVLAGGSGEVAVALMVGSLTLGTVLTPAWVATALGSGTRVGAGALIGELALCVALPLVVSLALRQRFAPALATRAGWCLDLSALSVVLVVVVAAGEARDLVGSPTVVEALGLCAALQAAGYASGAAVGRLLRLPRSTRRALLFPVGMREFGITATVALAVRPDAAAIAGIYGVLVMVSGPALAMRLRLGDRRRRATPRGRPSPEASPP